jgi:outer membrane protein TolC
MLLVLAAATSALTLDEAWSAADHQGVDTQLVREQYAAEKTTRGAAWSLVSPKLVLHGNWTRNDKEITFDASALIPESLQGLVDSGDPLVMQKLSYFDANLSVLQPLFSGTALPLLRAAYAQVDAAKEDLAANEGKLRSGVAAAYWGVLVAREGEAIAKDALATAQKHRKIIETSADVGLAAPTARIQAQIAESRAMRGVAAAEEGRVTAESAFEQLTGLDGDTPVEKPAPRALPWASLDEALAEARERRPSVLAANDRVRMARLAQTARALDWLPEVNGRFTYAWTQNQSAFNDRDQFWMVVVEGNWVLWDGGYRLAKQEESAAQKRMAVLAQTRELDTTEAELRQLWEKHAKAEASLETVTHELELARENLRISEVAFEAGSITFLDLEDARVGEAAARVSVLQEEMTRDLAAIDLMVAAGRL